MKFWKRCMATTLSAVLLLACMQGTVLADGTVQEAAVSEAAQPSVDALAQEDLQSLVDAAAAGGTLTLDADKTYTGATIDKELTIEGNGAAILGTVTSTAPLTLKDLTITGDAASAVDCRDSLDMQGCTVYGGVSITDKADAKITILKNTLYYNTVNGNAAVTVEGESDGVARHERYQIGGALSDSYNTLAPNANTFINGGDGDGPAIVWPFTGATYWKTDWYGNKTELPDRLIAFANYWEDANGNDLLFSEVKVGGEIQYANEIPITYKSAPDYGYAVPPETFAYRKGGSNNLSTGAYIPNTRAGNVESGDYALLLFGRSFKTNGTSVPLFYYFDIEKIYPQDSGYTTTLSPPRRIQFLNAYCFKDSDYRTPFSAVELENLKIANDGGLYWQSFSPVLPLDITPESMVSYAGTTQSLSADFPRVWYDFQAPNLFYDPADSTKGAEFIRMENPNLVTDWGGNKTTMSYLTTTLNSPNKPNPVYAPSLSADGTWSGYDSVLDPDKDFFPFLPAFLTGVQQTPATNNAGGGVYGITVGNADDILMLQYVEWLDLNKPWKLPVLSRRNNLDCAQFLPVFQPAQLTIRPVSQNLTVEAVVDSLPTAPTSALAAIDANARYQDSTKRVVETANVSLLDDKEEPNTAAYDVMLARAKADTATKGRSYDYHFLSLLNKNDGNNVVTTTAEKTVFVPYPADYKTGDPILMMHFGGYQRMPADDITKATVSVIAESALTKEEKGFTFTTSDDMGAYIVAYGQQATPTPDPTPGRDPDPKPEVKPTPTPTPTPSPTPTNSPGDTTEEQPGETPPPTPAPEVTPAPTPTPTTPADKGEIDKVVDEATQHPETIIRDKETLKEKYPDLDIADLPVPLYWGPGFAVVQLPSGELIAIDSGLIPLGSLPQTGVNAMTADVLLGALLLSAAAFVAVSLLSKRKKAK